VLNFHAKASSFAMQRQSLFLPCEHPLILLPDQCFVQARILLCILFAASGVLLRPGCHPVVMMTQFVQQNVQQLVPSHGRLVKLAQVISRLRLFTNNSKPLKDILMIIIVASPHFPPQPCLPGANMYDAGRVVAIEALFARRKNHGIQSYSEIFPVRKQFQKPIDVTLIEDMFVSFSRTLPIDKDRIGQRRIVVVWAEFPVVLLLNPPLHDLRSRFTISTLHVQSLSMKTVANKSRP